MRSNINPSEFMLNVFKRYVGDDFNKMFLKSLSEDLNMKKLNGFCYAIISMLELKGVSCHISICDNKVSIMNENAIYMTYNLDSMIEIQTIQRLKFQLMIEWGMALNHSKSISNEQLLLAL